jgi:hypothetical protein
MLDGDFGSLKNPVMTKKRELEKASKESGGRNVLCNATKPTDE